MSSLGVCMSQGGPLEPGAPQSWMFACLPAPLSSHMFWVGAQFKCVGSLPHTFPFPGVILTPGDLSQTLTNADGAPSVCQCHASLAGPPSMS